VKRSLSLILPVRNTQATLAADVARILEIVPELTRHFEIVIMDTGSTDQTLEVAEELAMQYPQIRLCSAAGAVSAIHQGIRHTRGELVLAHDGKAAINAEQIARLWQSQRGNHREAEAPHEPLSRQTFSQHSAAATISIPSLATAEGGFHLIDANLINRLRRSLAAVRNMQWLGHDSTAANTSRQTTSPPEKSAQTMQATRKEQPQRPNYLHLVKERMQNLAWGE
jgi:glycosyltransferase involved in cell wall biosynthesis